MISIIDKFIVKQVVFACALAILILSGPTIVVSLIKHLPSDAIFSEFFLPSLYGIACMILYVTLPVPIAVAIVWTYSQLTSDGVLTVLYSAGISIFGVRAPAFFVAACAAVLGFAMSCYLAPYTANNIHDMLFSLRYDILPVLLKEGKFNKIDHGRQVIFFKRRLSNSVLSEVFIREVTDEQQEKSYTARWVMFTNDGEDSWIILHDGSMLIKDPNRKEIRSVDFERIVRPATRSEVLATATRRNLLRRSYRDGLLASCPQGIRSSGLSARMVQGSGETVRVSRADHHPYLSRPGTAGLVGRIEHPFALPDCFCLRTDHGASFRNCCHCGECKPLWRLVRLGGHHADDHRVGYRHSDRHVSLRTPRGTGRAAR